MSIEFREMDAETGRAHLDAREVRWCGTLQSLGNVRRKRNLDSGVETYNNAVPVPVVARSDRERLSCAAFGTTANCGSKFVIFGHELL